MFEVRNDEPLYTFLKDLNTKEQNCYGQNIELTEPGSNLRNQSLNINGDASIGENPNRYKQHGFYFNSDNCIGCHACESACSEKNDVPAHLAFRSVGFVEGGTYPDYQRTNISMACNHCDDPVCLKGCPTRAYTKYAEYGAVIQDPDICFGCGYCTWVCPYNAPQLDPVKGEVSKCNMCVDRLEVNLKPACVAACLGQALDFGVIENMPENRIQAKTEIPGFPNPDITHPNIRFQQTRSTPREMTRTDSMPLKYHKDDNGRFKPTVDEKYGQTKQWNLRKLLTSHESAHVIFTLCTQATVGAFLLMHIGLFLGLDSLAVLHSSQVLPTLLIALVIISTVGLYKLNMHLGKPHRFYRGFNNLKHSPVSREIACVSLFYTGLLGHSFFVLLGSHIVLAFLAGMFAFIAVIGGIVGVYYMYKLYRIPARPFWNHWQTGSAFVGAMLSYGTLIMATVAVCCSPLAAETTQNLLRCLALFMAAGLALEGIGHIIHARDMQASQNEGAASYYRQVTQYGKAYQLRNGLLGISLMLALVIAVTGLNSMLIGLALTLMLLSVGTLGRSLFFALVIPTTMPGAFFWKNEGFVEHARETGLADSPQHGVAYQRHHAFKVDELMQTIQENIGLLKNTRNFFKCWRK